MASTFLQKRLCACEIWLKAWEFVSCVADREGRTICTVALAHDYVVLTCFPPLGKLSAVAFPGPAVQLVAVSRSMLRY